MRDKEFIIEKDGKQFVDVVKLLPDRTSEIREIVKEVNGNKVTIYSRIRAKSKGSGSKKVTIKRYIELDELFFEGLGLWVAEGDKSKGIYFGNTCENVLEKFMKFVESKFGILRTEFKVRIIVPKLDIDEDTVKEKWSKKLKIPLYNFTRISIKENTDSEYAYPYFNSKILIELLKLLYKKLKSIILKNTLFASAFMRGIIAGEGQVELKPWKTLSYVSISTANLDELAFYKKCLNTLGINSSKYEKTSRKFPIYGRRNLEKMKLYRLLEIHPLKYQKFEFGLSNYKRCVTEVIEMKKLILQELNRPKTYTEISNSLNKGRSTIQSFYIPMLEKEGFVTRIGKQKQAWMFKITKKGADFLKNLN